tara:strand:- start:26 stop:190 length:165 start_codon:yes stop_codon:yes gene_type:complete
MNFAFGEILNHKNLALSIKISKPTQLTHNPISVNLELVEIVEYLTATNETIKKK